MSFICSGQDQPADALGDLHFMEIDEQAEWNVEQFHVAEELRFVERQCIGI
jgi:hypothetical protein